MNYLCCLLLTVSITAMAQEPAFEAAAVKVHKGGGGTTREIQPGSIRYLNITLGEFIMMAYGVRRYQIAGPDWAVSNASPDRYDVIARAANGASSDQIHRMLGPLLADRFGLRFHRETRELPVFALTLQKGGPRFAPGDDGESSVVPDGKGGMKFTNYPMDAMSQLLSNFPAIGRPVIDRTGLTGRYTFSANLMDTPAGAPPGDIKKAADGDPMASPVFSNLSSQLGLRLESIKAPIDMIVIDHVAKTPTEN